MQLLRKPGYERPRAQHRQDDYRDRYVDGTIADSGLADNIVICRRDGSRGGVVSVMYSRETIGM